MNGLVDGMLYEVLKVFARLLAPDSLLLEDGHADDEDGDNSAFVSGGADPRVPRSGDIVLTSTPGSFFLFWRMLTRQRYDHVVRPCAPSARSARARASAAARSLTLAPFRSTR
jgi:hypothetical protein